MQVGWQHREWREVKLWSILNPVLLEYVDDNSPPIVRNALLGELDGATINAMFRERTSEQTAVISVILKWDVRVCGNRPHHRRRPLEIHEALLKPQSLPKHSENE